MRRWIEIAVSRRVRELRIFNLSYNQIFPSSFYTCKSLEMLKLSGLALMVIEIPSMVCLPSLRALKLEYVTFKDVPSMVSLPSLKTLELENVTFASDGSLQQLLSTCPVLEDLSVQFFGRDDMREFKIIVPTLQSLTLYLPIDWDLEGYVIDTPSLKCFKLEDWNYEGNYREIKDMPKLKEAYVDVVDSNLRSVIRSITTSVKRLTICSEDVYGDGFVFNELEHLEICPCKKDSSNLLAQLLKDSPNLRVLEISHMKDHEDAEDDDTVSWNQLSPVPECLLSSLQSLKWSRYFGRPQDRNIVVYILNKARHLKTATILADTMEHNVSIFRMIKELRLSSRASSACELVLVEDPHLVSDYESSSDESSA